MAGKGLVSKVGAMKVAKSVIGTEQGDNSIAQAFAQQVTEFHSLDQFWSDYGVESLLLKQAEWELKMIRKRPTYDPKVMKFNPSGASKCERELFFKATGVEADTSEMFPYHKRWLRNAEAVHSATQRDMLYMEKLLKNPEFTVARVEEVLGADIDPERIGLPAWERNLLHWKEFNHEGQEFIINGMADGILKHKGKLVGFEFKTKSTTVATVGDYKMKDGQDSHKQQCISYSCLFFGDPYEERTDSFVLMYESLAKDGWMKGAEARADFRTFQVDVDREQRMELLNKFANVTKMGTENNLPDEDIEKCFFCPFKAICKGEM